MTSTVDDVQGVLPPDIDPQRKIHAYNYFGRVQNLTSGKFNAMVRKVIEPNY